MESALPSRQGELDSSVSQKYYLSDRIDLSTLTISFTSSAEDAPANSDRLRNAIVSGRHAPTGRPRTHRASSRPKTRPPMSRTGGTAVRRDLVFGCHER
ncbi:hypothetical protein CH272_27025 [Rhodococcus sp. 05-340-1]|nr:hypothetical protein CH271_12210 [Rhodococcus sp. 05-340-2]OZD70292.1 hypothetical protein CH272_27025 [Rhodococcus sp. 05-340-1]